MKMIFKFVIIFAIFCLLEALQQNSNSKFQTLPFVTQRRYNFWQTAPAENYNDIRNMSVLIKNGDKNPMLNFYNLRYQPLFLWKKLKLKFNQSYETTTQSTINQPEETTTMTTLETTTIESEIITPTTTTTTTTTPTPFTTKPRPTLPLLTTPFPAPTFKPHWLDAFKKVLLYGSPFQANLLQKQPSQHHSGSKLAKGKGFLGLFEVINFNNTKCSVSMDDIRAMDGVCYHEYECKNLGGIPTKPCAEGAGVCCIFVSSCGDSSDQSVLYFESPNYPNPVREMMICVLIINLRPNVEQLRLDFIMFELNRPTNGECNDDQFIVSGQNMNYAVPILCGINTGQHIYLHVGNSFENKIYLSFFAKVPKGGRSFNIKILQLEDNLAPPNCLQYFNEAEGIVKSFNYDIDGSIVDNKEATYLNNLNYAICIQRAKETCTVTYVTEQGNGEVPDFQIINKDEDENDLVPDGQAGAGIFNCPDDFIAINSVRLCGERFNDGTDNEDFTMHAAVHDIAAGPILLPVRTDGEYVGRGFRLLYRQNLCV